LTFNQIYVCIFGSINILNTKKKRKEIFILYDDSRNLTMGPKMESPNVLKPLTNSLTAVFGPINVPIIRICGSEENAPSILSNIINSPMQCVLPSEEEKKRATNGKDPEEYIVPPIGLKPFNQLCDSKKRKRLAIIRAEINKLNSWLKSRYAMEIKGIDLVAYDPNVPRKNFKNKLR
jgi:hypothetical protein